MFNKEKCDLCGSCLVSCAYVDYSREKAFKEMRALIDNSEAEILRDCITCFACNEYCEKGANPFELISDLQEKRGTISVTPQTLGMFEQIIETPSIIIRGRTTKPVLSLCAIEPFIGPDLLQSELFKDMTQVKGGDYFCYYAMLHTGKASILNGKGKKFIQNLINLNSDEIVFFHDECHTMVTKMMKEIKIPFKATHILGYINSYLKENWQHVKPINKKIAYQRPCSSRTIPEIEVLLQEFFELIGVERVKRKYDGKDALCCGAAIMGLGQYGRGEEVVEKNMKDILSCKPDALVYLCPLCGHSFAEPCKMYQLPAIFVADLARMALREIPFPEQS
ncbi:MAG: (Fe-S)-binding protein [Syntrophorhabdaceae bacterium]|nr:(Fe-S)-binding protein [Syntrophorhabdaceae bacterium]